MIVSELPASGIKGAVTNKAFADKPSSRNRTETEQKLKTRYAWPAYMDLHPFGICIPKRLSAAFIFFSCVI